MSLKLGKLLEDDPRSKKLSRAQLLALHPEKDYSDGRTKQCFADECDIDKIMARFDKTQTISHVAKYEGTYADFSDFDFHGHLNKMNEGQAIFDDLPAELRQEFGQSPAKFFEYVNDPANADQLQKKLTGLAKPGRQMPGADQTKAEEAAQKPVEGKKAKPEAEASAGGKKPAE